MRARNGMAAAAYLLIEDHNGPHSDTLNQGALNPPVPLVAQQTVN